MPGPREHRAKIAEVEKMIAEDRIKYLTKKDKLAADEGTSEKLQELLKKLKKDADESKRPRR